MSKITNWVFAYAKYFWKSGSSHFLLFSNMSCSPKPHHFCRCHSFYRKRSSSQFYPLSFKIQPWHLPLSPSSSVHGRLLSPLSPCGIVASQCYGAAYNYVHTCFPPWVGAHLEAGTVFFIHSDVVSSSVPGAYLTSFSMSEGERSTVDRKSGIQVTKHQPERAGEGTPLGS